jgi:chromosome segregation ATPase
MKLVKLKLTSFKNFVSQEFEFGDKNILTGKNGVGKSAIKDAILFLLFNRTADGSLADSSKFISYGQPKCEVEATFDNGMIIRRERTEKSTRITHLDDSQSMEDSGITQRELESMVPSFQIFNTVFNVGSFMMLDDKEKRDIILSFTNPVDRMAIYNQSGGKPEWIERYKLNIEDCKATHKMLLHNRKLISDDITSCLGQLSILSEPIEIPKATKEDVSSKISDLEVAVKEYAKYEKDKAVFIRDKRAAESQEAINQDAKKTIDELAKKITAAKMPSRDVANGLQNEISNLQAKIRHYELLPKEALCPSCDQTIPDTHRHLVGEEITKAKTELGTLTSLLADEMEKYNNAISAVTTDNELIQKMTREEARIRKVIHPKDIVEVPKPNTKLFEELREMQGAFVAEKQYIEKLMADEVARQTRFDSITNKIGKAKSIIKDLDVLLPIFSPGGITSVEMRVKVVPVNNVLSKYLRKSEIKLQELLKNGLDTKEVFDIRVDGREYKRLSTGERLKTDIAISEMLDELSGYQVGMKFVDNGESIDHIPEISPQSFIANVTQDTQLKIIN